MQAVDSQPIRILLVEDNPGDARLVTEILRSTQDFRYTLKKETSLGEAFQRLQEAPLDIVLLDLGLPDGQGIDTLRRLDASCDLPIVVLTVDDRGEMGVRALRNGAQDYLVKGHIDAWLLPRVLNHAIERLEHQRQATQAQVRIREAEVRAEEARRTQRDLEREVVERRRAEQQVQQLNQTLTQRVNRLAALHAIDRVINASMDLHLTLEVVLEQITEQLRVDAATVLLFHEESLTLEFAASEGFASSGVRERRIRLGKGVIGQAVMQYQSVHLPDLRTEVGDLEGRELVGSEGFVCYHATPLMAKGQLRGLLEVFHRDRLDFNQDWLGFFAALAEQTAIALDNAILLRKLQDSNNRLALAYDRTIEGWSQALGFKDEETAEHSQRVTEMTVRLAKHMGVKGEALAHIRRGALLHDIGKMAVPDRILLKPGKLTEEEWQAMRRHTTAAYELLTPITFLRPALDIPYCHHEKWDGSGYPRGLRGEQIPLAARIFAVVDVWDALSSDRPYRKAWPREKVLAYLKEQAGKHFDAAVVKTFLELVDAPES